MATASASSSEPASSSAPAFSSSPGLSSAPGPSSGVGPSSAPRPSSAGGPSSTPAPSSPTEPGTLVVISGLTSARGQTLNGKFGIIRDGKAAAGRVEVEIFARHVRDRVLHEKPCPTVSLKPSNLDLLDDDVAQRAGFPMLEQYLKHQAFDLQDSLNPDFEPEKGEKMYWKHGKQSTAAAQEELCRVWAERLTVPGFVPEVDDNSTLGTFLRAAGHVEEATELFQQCIAAVTRDDPRWNGLCFDLARCLIDGRRCDDAMEAIGEIAIRETDEEDAVKYYKKIKGEALMKLYVQCAREPDMDAVKERVLRAYLDVHPDEGWIMHDLGDLLCRRNEFEEGVKYYRLAQEKGKGKDGSDYRSPALDGELSLALKKMQIRPDDGSGADAAPSANLSSG